MNLNAFINPMGTSSYLMTLPNGTEGQMKATSILIGCHHLSSTLLLAHAKGMFANTPKSVLYFWAFIILFSLSNRVYLGSGLIFGANLPEWLMKSVSPFRSSGRYAWFVIYPVLAISFTNAHSYIKDKFWPVQTGHVGFFRRRTLPGNNPIPRHQEHRTREEFDVLPLAERVDLKVAKAIRITSHRLTLSAPFSLDVSDTNTNKDLFTL